MAIMKNIKQSESWKLGNEAITRWSLEMPEMSGKCISNPTKTNNLIYILKITQKNEETDSKKRIPINKLRVWNFFWKPETDPKKEETDPKKTRKPISKLRIYNFLKTGNEPIKWGKGPKKKRKRTQKKWKLINKLRIYNFFWKSETDPKNEETDPKKEETDQQTEN